MKSETFWKFIQISSKQRSFLHTLPMWVHDRGFHPLQPQMLLPASEIPVTRGVQSLIKSYEKFWICSFLSISFANEQALSQNCNLTFRQKQCFYLAHSVPEYFEKLPIKNANQTKNSTLSVYILNTGVNSESKQKYSESSFNFLQPKYNPRCHYQCLAKFKMLIFVFGFVILHALLNFEHNRHLLHYFSNSQTA